MHEFQRRTQQFLDSAGELSAGHKERLSRPIKQTDLRSWEALDDASADAALKAAMRVLVHETLESTCLQVEAALAACRSVSARLLVLALHAHASSKNLNVGYDLGDTWAGAWFPSALTLWMVPAPADAAGAALQLRLDAWSGSPPMNDHRAANNLLASGSIVITDSSSGFAPVQLSIQRTLLPCGARASAYWLSDHAVSADPFACARQVLDDLLSASNPPRGQGRG